MDGGDPPPRQKAHVLLRQMDAVRGLRAHVEQVVTVEQLRRRQPGALLAVLLLLLRLGQVQLHPEAVFQRVFRERLPRRIGRGVFRVDAAVDSDAAAVIAMPFVVERLGFAEVGVGIGVKIVGAVGRDGVAEIGLDAGFRDGLGDGVRAEIHIADGGHAEAQALGDGQQRRRLDAPRVHALLLREDAPAEPLGERQLLAVAAQQRHRQMRVAVDKARHQHHARAVENALRLFLRRVFPDVGDLAVRDAQKGVHPDGHPLVHRHDGNV